MSLPTDPQQNVPPAPISESASPAPSSIPSKKPKPTDDKKQQALKIAEQYKDKSWSSAYPEMQKTAEKQGVKLSRTTLYRAHREITEPRRKAFQKEGKPQQPSLKIAAEQEKNPENVQQPSGEAIEELPTVAPTETAEGIDTEYIKDMLRGVHAAFLSKDGLLGEKYGRKLEQCNTVSDQLYRYITKRVSPEQLESYDTAFLFTSYLSLILPILNEYRKERAKNASKPKPEQRAP